MTPRMQDMAVAFGLLVLGSLASQLVGCGTNPDEQDETLGPLDSGSAQGGSKVQAGSGGAAGGIGRSGTGGDVQTGYECLAGGAASGTATAAPVPRACYPYATGAFYCNRGVCGCYYHPVTGCLCADNTVSPCKPLDPACTASTAHGTRHGKHRPGHRESEKECELLLRFDRLLVVQSVTRRERWRVSRKALSEGHFENCLSEFHIHLVLAEMRVCSIETVCEKLQVPLRLWKRSFQTVGIDRNEKLTCGHAPFRMGMALKEMSSARVARGGANS